jgi:hypothetical protein
MKKLAAAVQFLANSLKVPILKELRRIFRAKEPPEMWPCGVQTRFSLD